MVFINPTTDLIAKLCQVYLCHKPLTDYFLITAGGMKHYLAQSWQLNRLTCFILGSSAKPLGLERAVRCLTMCLKASDFPEPLSPLGGGCRKVTTNHPQVFRHKHVYEINSFSSIQSYYNTSRGIWRGLLLSSWRKPAPDIHGSLVRGTKYM